MPSPVDMKEPHWYVVSDKNIEEFQKKIKKETGGVFFAMTPGDYELMAYNLQEIKRFVKETKEVIVYYRTVTLTDEELDVINKSKETTPEKKSFLDTFKRNTDERSESNSGELEMHLEFKRKELEDQDAMRDAQRKMAWFALGGMLLYPFAVVMASLAGLDQAQSTLGSMAPTYFVAVAGIVAAFFGAQAFTKK